MKNIIYAIINILLKEIFEKNINKRINISNNFILKYEEKNDYMVKIMF